MMYQPEQNFPAQDNPEHRIPQFAGDMFDFHRLANLLRAKAWIIAAIALVVFIAAATYIMWAPKIYDSRAIIQVHQEAQKIVNIASVSEDKPETNDYLNSVAQAFTSRKLMLRVIRSTGLDKDPLFAPPKADGSPYTEIELADLMSQKVSVSVRRNTRLLDIIVSDTNPKVAQMLAAAFVREFLREAFEQRREISRVANEFLQDEAKQLQAKLEEAERKLQIYKEKNKAVSLEERQNIIVEKLQELNTAATEAKNSRLRLEADLAQVKRIDPANVDGLLRIASVTKIPQVSLVREQLLKAENQFATMKKNYLPRHPRYIAAQTAIANFKEALSDALSKAGDTLAREYEAARQSEEKITQFLQQQEQKAMELNRIAIPYNVLQRDVASDRALFESVTLRLKETHVTAGMDSPLFRVIEEPLIATYPSKPRKKFILALALVMGLTLGAGTVVGLDAVDDSLRTVDEAESYLELPALASIPKRRTEFIDLTKHIPKRASELVGAAKKIVNERHSGATPLVDLSGRFLRKIGVGQGNGSDPAKTGKETGQLHPLVLAVNSGSEQAEAFRTLRSSISLLGKESDYRSFLFTSAIPSEGKTFTCLNFALSLAQQGFNTVIIDADLREPRLKQDLLAEAGPVAGLAELLSGQISLGNTLKSTDHNNLVLLPAGHTAADPAQLLDNKEFSRVLNELLRNFDRVVIDSPPVNAVSDVLLIAEYAQATLLVVQAGRTPKRVVHRAITQLHKARARVAGFVFNRLPVGGRSAGYYYYYYGDRYAKNGAYKESEAHSSSGASAQ
jgi:polysaccharide biosynthesis transport protein